MLTKEQEAMIAARDAQRVDQSKRTYGPGPSDLEVIAAQMSQGPRPEISNVQASQEELAAMLINEMKRKHLNGNR